MSTLCGLPSPHVFTDSPLQLPFLRCITLLLRPIRFLSLSNHLTHPSSFYPCPNAQSLLPPSRHLPTLARSCTPLIGRPTLLASSPIFLSLFSSCPPCPPSPLPPYFSLPASHSPTHSSIHSLTPLFLARSLLSSFTFPLPLPPSFSPCGPTKRRLKERARFSLHSTE